MARELSATAARNLSPREVETRLSELKEKLFKLRFQNTMRQLDNPLEIRDARREIAVLKTLLREHALGIRKLAATK
jgi:large subunit ribosomal protein L29